jgi:hypothetical protein
MKDGHLEDPRRIELVHDRAQWRALLLDTEPSSSANNEFGKRWEDKTARNDDDRCAPSGVWT